MKTPILVLLLALAAPAAAQVPLYDMTDPDVLLDQRLAPVGDLDGDGFSDFAVGSPATDFLATDSGVIRAYSGDGAALLFEVFGPEAYDQLGASIDGTGDVDADGFPDLIGGSGTFQGNVARVWSGADGSLLHDLSAGAHDSFGRSVSGFGDADLDGHADFAVAAPQDFLGLPGYVRAYSGATGAMLKQWQGDCAQSDFGRSLARLGDVTGDGLPDLGIYQMAKSPGCTSEAFVVSLAGLEHTFHAWGTATMGLDGVGLAGDVDGDGLPDVAVGSPGSGLCSGPGGMPGELRVHSGATGATLLDVGGASGCTWLGYAVDGVGDVDGDGRDDVAAGAIGQGRIAVYSGADQSLLMQTASPSGGGFGYGVVGLGDLDGDGRPEIGGLGPLSGAWVFSTCPGALAPNGAGCPGSGGKPPRLDALGCPAPGNPITVRVRNGYGGAPAMLAIGTGAGSLPLGGGCNLLVSAIKAIAPIGPLFDFGPGMGYRDVTLTIPLNAAGLTFQLQAAHLDPGLSHGFALSNGLRVEVP